MMSSSSSRQLYSSSPWQCEPEHELATANSSSSIPYKARLSTTSFRNTAIKTRANNARVPAMSQLSRILATQNLSFSHMVSKSHEHATESCEYQEQSNEVNDSNCEFRSLECTRFSKTCNVTSLINSTGTQVFFALFATPTRNVEYVASKNVWSRRKRLLSWQMSPKSPFDKNTLGSFTRLYLYDAGSSVPVSRKATCRLSYISRYALYGLLRLFGEDWPPKASSWRVDKSKEVTVESLKQYHEHSELSPPSCADFAME
mmetsp:Transcript_21497/g.62912  ORF Transcript_21497/g.62912 Transcript_21497/m.62912 type:complete len:259 (+) Transcript_21497:1214-1990(+)